MSVGKTTRENSKTSECAMHIDFLSAIIQMAEDETVCKKKATDP